MTPPAYSMLDTVLLAIGVGLLLALLLLWAYEAGARYADERVARIIEAGAPKEVRVALVKPDREAA